MIYGVHRIKDVGRMVKTLHPRGGSRGDGRRNSSSRGKPLLLDLLVSPLRRTSSSASVTRRLDTDFGCGKTMVPEFVTRYVVTGT